MLTLLLLWPLVGGMSGTSSQATPAAADLQPPKLAHALTLRVQVGAPVELGQVPRGRRGWSSTVNFQLRTSNSQGTLFETMRFGSWKLEVGSWKLTRKHCKELED
jgi:hypothetical protein